MARFLNFTVVKENSQNVFSEGKKKNFRRRNYFLKERFQDEVVFLGPRKVCSYHGFQRNHTFNFFCSQNFLIHFMVWGICDIPVPFFPMWLKHFFKKFFGARERHG